MCFVFPDKFVFEIVGNIESDDSSLSEKKSAITTLFSSDPVDLNLVKEMAISPHGLVDHDTRKKAWPLLLGVNESSSEPKPGWLSWFRL